MQSQNRWCCQKIRWPAQHRRAVIIQNGVGTNLYHFRCQHDCRAAIACGLCWHPINPRTKLKILQLRIQKPLCVSLCVFSPSIQCSLGTMFYFFFHLNIFLFVSLDIRGKDCGWTFHFSDSRSHCIIYKQWFLFVPLLLPFRSRNIINIYIRKACVITLKPNSNELIVYITEWVCAHSDLNLNFVFFFFRFIAN